ncbi:hypothetical protein ORL95_18200 [Bacillus cereus]|nr:hypothetical protein [Bacillus cereus]
MNQTILEKVLKFRDDRNWKQFHNPKDLAISLSLEASELADQLDIDLEEIIINKIEKIIKNIQ